MLTNHVQGIDVSTFQGAINWPKVAQGGIGFAYVKASEGAQKDPKREAYYRLNIARIRSSGILGGAYHFARFNVDSNAQADRCLEAIGGRVPSGDMPVMVDVEAANGVAKATLIPRLHHLLEEIEKGAGVQPVIYTYSSFWNEYFDASFSKYRLWIAAYGADKPTKPVVPNRAPSLTLGWRGYSIWQYDDKGDVPGVSSGPGTADLDIFPGTKADLVKFAAARRTQVAVSAKASV